MASHDEVAICPYCQKTFVNSTRVLQHLRFCKKNPHTIGTGLHRSVKKSHRLRARDIRFVYKAPQLTHAAPPKDWATTQQDATNHVAAQPVAVSQAAPGAIAAAGAGAAAPTRAPTAKPVAALDCAPQSLESSDDESSDSMFASEPELPGAAASPDWSSSSFFSEESDEGDQEYWEYWTDESVEAGEPAARPPPTAHTSQTPQTSRDEGLLEHIVQK